MTNNVDFLSNKGFVVTVVIGVEYVFLVFGIRGV